MEDFIKKMQKEIDKGINVATVKSKEFLNSAKLWTDIWSLREDKRQAFEEIGQAVYRMSQDKNFNGAGLIREKCERVASCEAQLSAKETALQRKRQQTEERRGW